MKALVMKTSAKGAVLLREDGVFEEVARTDLTVGQQIDSCVRLTVLRRGKAVRLIAACLVLAVLLTGGAMACYTPYTYITIGDANSVTLTLNVFDLVIAADGDDDDAQKVAGELVSDGILYSSADDALSRTLDRYDPPNEQNPQQDRAPIPVSVGSRSEQHAFELVDHMDNKDRPHCVDIHEGGPKPGQPGGRNEPPPHG